jgi:hypothetical protein
MTPHNAIEILFTHIKQVDYTHLLDYATGPEAKRLELLISNMQQDRRVESLVRRQAHELGSYRIHKEEVHTNVAAIMFSWRYQRTSALTRVNGRPATVLVEDGCEALLVRKDNVWKIASIRAWVPETERGSAFLSRQNNDKKNVPRKNR